MQITLLESTATVLIIQSMQNALVLYHADNLNKAKMSQNVVVAVNLIYKP